MPLANTAARYGAVTKCFHWATALMIITLIPLGIIATNLPFDTDAAMARKAWLFSAHKTLGILLFVTALARILWAITQTKPAPLHPERRVESFLAEMVHWLLYGSLIMVPLTGWLYHSASSVGAPIWIPGIGKLPWIPQNESVAHSFAALHIIFERVLAVSLVLHVVGALKHHFMDRDATLRRMWFGKAEATADPVPHNPALPVVGAGVAWAAALLIGTGMGLFAMSETPAAPTVQLQQAASDWQVQDGTIAIRVTQFGSVTEGQFSDWTSAITYDPETGTGDVTTTIAIPSLTLGTVTDQAMQTDYFNAAEHPTATYQGNISREGDGPHMATGTLTLKGTAIPVSFPFDLTITDDTATMTGTLTLNRIDFGIGSDDTGSLAAEVEVTLNVTAAKGG